MGKNLPTEKVEELFKLYRAIVILIDVADHSSHFFFRSLIAKLFHHSSQFLDIWVVTLWEIIPSPLESSILKACLNSSICSLVSLESVINEYSTGASVFYQMSERNEVQERRFSLKEMSKKVEQQIFRYLPIHSQPTEFEQQEIQPRKYSQPIDFVPLGYAGGNSSVQSLRGYQSQKNLHSNTKPSIDDVLNKTPKKFTINTLSLKQLEPLKDKCFSLPRIKKRSPQHLPDKKAELQWITPSEMMAMKLKMSKKQLPKLVKEPSQITMDKRYGKRIFNSVKNDIISGWHIQQNYQNDLYD